MSQNAITAKNVTKNFKIQKRSIFQFVKNLNSNQHKETLTALDDVSFQVQKGEILGIIGGGPRRYDAGLPSCFPARMDVLGQRLPARDLAGLTGGRRGAE